MSSPRGNLTSTHWFSTGLAGLATTLLALSIALQGIGNWQAVAVLVLIAVVAEGRSMPVRSTLELSVAYLPVILAGILFGPGAGGLVGLMCMAGDRDGPPLRWVVFASSRTISGVAAGWAALAATNAVGMDEMWQFVVVAVLSAVATMAVDVTVMVIVTLLRKPIPLRQFLNLIVPSLGLTASLYTPLVALYAFAYANAGMIVLAFLAIPLLAAHLSHSMFAQQRHLIEQLTTTNARLEEANDHLRSVNLSFAWAMIRTLEARDRYTAGHSTAVAVYSRDIAAEMGLDEATVELVYLAGLVHDIGKIGLSAEILNKKSALTDEEWDRMREHSEIGANILLAVEDYREVASIVRSHHERIDGAGYPDRLVGDQIPQLSRVIAVADAYNAMTSSRPYRDAMAPETALGQLVNGKGTQFQPDAVDAFVQVFQRSTHDYRIAAGPQFSRHAMQTVHLHEAARRPELRAAVA
jgi:putative nucleotidyltransferase with HDIG domain